MSRLIYKIIVQICGEISKSERPMGAEVTIACAMAFESVIIGFSSQSAVICVA